MQRPICRGAVDSLGAAHEREIMHPPQQTAGNARRAARTPGNLIRPLGRHADAEDARAAGDDLLEFGLGIEIQPHRNAEAVPQRIGQQARARGGADQCEFREIDLHRTRCRPLPDNEIELKVLHCRIEDFLYCRIELVDLVDEQHIAMLEVGEERSEIARFGDDRPRGGAEIHTELAGDDLRQRRLSQAGRAYEQHVIERLLSGACRLNEHRQVRARLALADEVGEALGAQRGVAVLVPRFGAHEPRRARDRIHSVRSRLYLFGISSPIGAMTGPFWLGTITRAFRS